MLFSFCHIHFIFIRASCVFSFKTCVENIAIKKERRKQQKSFPSYGSVVGIIVSMLLDVDQSLHVRSVAAAATGDTVMQRKIPYRKNKQHGIQK